MAEAARRPVESGIPALRHRTPLHDADRSPRTAICHARILASIDFGTCDNGILYFKYAATLKFHERDRGIPELVASWRVVVLTALSPQRSTE